MIIALLCSTDSDYLRYRLLNPKLLPSDSGGGGTGLAAIKLPVIVL